MNMGQGGQIDEMSMQISYRFMNMNLQDCFKDCVNDFRSGELSSNETTCMKNCGARSFGALQWFGQIQQQQAGQMQGGGRGF